MIDSPCNRVCVLDGPSGYCIGCGRSADEIAAWPAATDMVRARILAALPERLAGLPHARQRREAR